MTLEDLGNLGELTAAVATIATLVYLAQQIRNSTKSVQGSSAQSLMHLEVSTFALIAQHASVFQRGNADLANLNPEEEVVFEQLVSAVMSLMVSGFIQFQIGLLPDYDTYLLDWENNYLKKPGFRSMWAIVRHSYPDDFCQLLDTVAIKTEGSA